jgi:hypothetical protein
MKLFLYVYVYIRAFIHICTSKHVIIIGVRPCINGNMTVMNPLPVVSIERGPGPIEMDLEFRFISIVFIVSIPFNHITVTRSLQCTSIP